MAAGHRPRPAGAARWLAIAAIVLLAVVLYQALDLGRLLSFDALKQNRDALIALFERRPAATLGGFAALYIAVAALSLPGAGIMTLAAGAMFGFWTGLVLVSFASSIGATLAFLASRYLLRDWVGARFGKRLAAVDEGMRRDGALYLLTLRLVPVFPFFLVNLLVGLTPMSVPRFYVFSQLGMLAGTAVYVNAGTQLAAIDRLGDIVSPGLLASLVLLGVFPLIAKAVVDIVQRRKVYADWPRPAKFDRNLVVIGAGSAGLVTAYIAAAVKAKVTLVESHRMGGDCLNTGCVPSKALIRSAKLANQLRRAEALGGRNVSGSVDFGAVMARIRRVIADIEPHDSVARYTALGVDVVTGHARIVSPWEVELTTADGVRRMTTRSIVIATGARPLIPAIPGLEAVGYVTSDTVWNLDALPKRLLVLGGGPIGCELAQSFARLGSQVTQVELAPRLMLREDPEVSVMVADALRADGVDVRTGHEAVRCEIDGAGGEGSGASGENAAGAEQLGRRMIVRQGGAESAIPFDVLLCAVGRAPRVEGFGLEALGITTTARKTVAVDAYLRTRFPNILAVGDVAGPYQLTHVAAHQAWYGAVNALFGRWRRFKADYRVIPWATFTDPEVARVGLSEAEAAEQGIEVEVTRYELDELDRAIADGTTRGFVKVLTVPGKDRILGVTIVGEHAGDLIAEYVLAMKQGIGLKRMLGTIHIYPTLAEANKAVAGNWQRAHAPARLLAWVERFHAWQRG